MLGAGSPAPVLFERKVRAMFAKFVAGYFTFAFMCLMGIAAGEVLGSALAKVIKGEDSK